MAKTTYKTVDEYIASQPRALQPVLERVRRIVRKALPEAEEVISYQIAAYKIDGRTVLYFAGWKDHFSIYPSTDRLVVEFDKELAPYEISKGTIRFPLAEPVPAKLIEKIARFRANEAAERRKVKAAAAKTRTAPRKTRAAATKKKR
jgi:uncharacterized protein YdhG (YjbR/CyaY superfamily)